MDYNLYRLLWVFLIYSFVGWCVEVIYAALVLGKFVNRGFLNGPVCPIYGFGMVCIVLILTPIEHSFILLFTGSVILTTVLEFVVGFVLERFFGEKWWDYSDERLNFKGYICVKFSLLWGIGCVMVMKAVHPAVMFFIKGMETGFGGILAAVFTALIVTDAVITITAMVKMRHKLRAIEELGVKIKIVSNKIGGTLAESAMTVKDKYTEGREQFDEKFGDDIDEIKEKYEDGVDAIKEKYGDGIDSIKGKYAEELAELKVKAAALIDENSFIKRRILNAYPKLKNRLYKGNIAEIMKNLSEKLNKK